MGEQWETIGQEDVIELQESFSQDFINIPMFKSEKLQQLMFNKALNMSTQNWESDHPNDILKRKWVEGLNAEVLKVGGNGWKKGKIRVKVTVEFLPNDPESPLDEIRNSIN